jgi:hypothetical protein
LPEVDARIGRPVVKLADRVHSVFYRPIAQAFRPKHDGRIEIGPADERAVRIDGQREAVPFKEADLLGPERRHFGPHGEMFSLGFPLEPFMPIRNRPIAKSVVNASVNA